MIVPVLVLGQSSNQNYVKTTTYKQPTTTSIPTPSAQQAAQTVGYFDGLGRPVQQIAGKMSGEGKDLITTIEYDSIGRQQREYLPLISAQDNLAFVSGSLRSGIASQYQIFYGDSIGYSRKQFEESPLNRIFKQSAPGNDWAMGSGHEVRFDYQANVEKEVRLFGVTANYSETTLCYEPGLIDNGNFYDANTLYKTITKNENWVSGTDNTTEEFKDKEGHVILKRTYNGEAYDTYYVYDDYGNLTYVIPPVADTNSTITQSMLDNLCYQYKYDRRNRMVEKKLPCKQWEYIVYNSQDKPVATGPALDPFGGSTVGFLITKYDAFGRVVYTGWLPIGTSMSKADRVTFQNQPNMNNGEWRESYQSSPITVDSKTLHYTNNVYPTDGYKLLSINYYDNYDFVVTQIPTAVEGETVLTNPKGLATGSWVRVLENPSATIGELSYTLYDVKGRTIRNYAANYLGGLTKTDSKLDFTGKAKYTITTHKRLTADDLTTVREDYKYNGQDRLIQHTHKINNLPKQFLAVNHYDKLGQLVLKDVGNDSIAPYQKVNYKYNIRGWLTDINNVDSLKIGSDVDLFAFRINYNGPIQNDKGGEIVPLYNGNIAETNWISDSDHILRRYGYTYDKLNRLTIARYQKPNNASPMTNMYDERLTYDKNGNIQSLQRNGDFDSDIYAPIQIDDLEYQYDTDKKNQLVKVKDYSNSPKGFKDNINSGNPYDDTYTAPGADYTYDANGNMLSDLNKGITAITYNHLNLPVQITFGSGSSIAYLYDANGKKLRKKITANQETLTTDYLDGFQYVENKLNFFPHAEGYVNATFCTACETPQYLYNYVYQYKDHLGNIRVSYGYDAPSEKLKILEENNYYPFGLKHGHYNTKEMKYEPSDDDPAVTTIKDLVANGMPTNKYKFQGQERQDELGLNWDSFKWRNYDYAIGRFMNIDPLAEDYAYNSPYAFAENKLGLGRELEGCELAPFVSFSSAPIELFGASDALKFTTEVGTKTSEGASKMTENFSKGRGTEAEQLAENGYEKNTKPMEATDPKTGQKGTTIPDAVKPDGGTVEIKNVQRQALTEQLRLQKEISTGKGVKPELIINKAAKLTKPLQNAGFDIKTYTTLGIVLDKAKVSKPKVEHKKHSKIDIKIISFSKKIY